MTQIRDLIELLVDSVERSAPIYAAKEQLQEVLIIDKSLLPQVLYDDNVLANMKLNYSNSEEFVSYSSSSHWTNVITEIILLKSAIDNLDSTAIITVDEDLEADRKWREERRLKRERERLELQQEASKVVDWLQLSVIVPLFLNYHKMY